MWPDLLQFVLAVLAFAAFPFTVIAAAAGVLVLMDRLTHFHNYHHHRHP